MPHALAHVYAATIAALAWCWHTLILFYRHPAALRDATPLQAGFIVAIIGAIVTVVTKVVSFIREAGGLVFKTVESAVRFAVRGVAWLTGVIRKGFAELLAGLRHTFSYLGDHLRSLWKDYQCLKEKLNNFFAPIIKTLKAIKCAYDHIWKKFVQPVLNFLQRVRKVLAVLRVFHIKWAAKLDHDLALVEAKIVFNTLLFRKYLNVATSWIDLIVDPLGILRTVPLLRGLLAGWNAIWSAVFGSPWNSSGAAPGVTNETANLDTTMKQGVAEIKTSTGDAGVIFDLAPGIRQDLYAEMGVVTRH